MENCREHGAGGLHSGIHRNRRRDEGREGEMGREIGGGERRGDERRDVFVCVCLSVCLASMYDGCPRNLIHWHRRRISPLPPPLSRFLSHLRVWNDTLSPLFATLVSSLSRLRSAPPPSLLLLLFLLLLCTLGRCVCLYFCPIRSYIRVDFFIYL